MKINNIITVVNDRPEYTEILPLFRRAWTKLYNIEPIVGVIEGNYDQDPQPHVTFPRDNNIDSGIQAKITRMYLATLFERYSMVVDVDMIPLDGGFFEVVDRAKNNDLVQWGYDHPVYSTYSNGISNVGKWPMDKTCAHRLTWAKIVNPKGLDYKNWIESLYEITEAWCSVKTCFSLFSDESLLKLLLEKSGHEHVCKIKRSEYNNKNYKGKVHGRLDRVEHGNDYNPLDYFEAHGARPYSQHKDWYKNIETYLEGI